jgi:hypothetical protein
LLVSRRTPEAAIPRSSPMPETAEAGHRWFETVRAPGDNSRL